MCALIAYIAFPSGSFAKVAPGRFSVPFWRETRASLRQGTDLRVETNRAAQTLYRVSNSSVGEGERYDYDKRDGGEQRQVSRHRDAGGYEDSCCVEDRI